MDLDLIIKQRKDTDVAWCAGFFDGEGHVGYHRSRPSKSGIVSPLLSASVPQNTENIETLEFFQSVIGFGKLYGPYIINKQSGKTQHILKFGTKTIQSLYFILRPYLKKEKTDDFLRAIQSFNSHNPSITSDDITRLAQLGCPKCRVEWNGMVCLKCGHGI